MAIFENLKLRSISNMAKKAYNTTDIRLCYRSPKTTVVFARPQVVLCGSPIGETEATEMEEGNNNW